MADEDVLVHVHVWKTAGTSVRTWLESAFPGGYGRFYPTSIFDEASLEAVGLRSPKVRAFSSHSMRDFLPVLCGRRMRYFTLLRNPLAHVISYARYSHGIATGETIGVDTVGGFRMKTVRARQEKAAGSRGAAGGFSLREAVAKIFQDGRRGAFTDNTQTNVFALHAWCRKVRATRGCLPSRYAEWPAADREAYRRERLEVAKDVLRTFLAVGTVERLGESLELLRQRSAAVGFQLPPPDGVPVLNASDASADDMSWISLDDPVGRTLIASVTDDMHLYGFADQLLARALRTSEATPDTPA